MRFTRLNLFVFGFSLLAVYLVLTISSPDNTAPKVISYTQFINQVKTGAVAKVLLPSESTGPTKVLGQDGAMSITYTPVSDPWMVSDLLKNGVDVQRAQPASGLLSVVIGMIPTILLVGIMIYYMNGSMRKKGTGIRMIKPGVENKITFADVAGCDEVKAEVSELVEFMKDPALYSRLGGRAPRGVLMDGDPGTGKTLLAKAIAGEAGVPFFSASGSDFVEMFVGLGAARVRKLFAEARKNAPCIVFIDEIDAIGRNRSGSGSGNDEREQTLNQILVELDGFSSRDGVIVIAATNRADVLDPALLRPGRFDRRVTMPLPDIMGREQILRVHSGSVTIGHDVSLHEIARGTPGFTGAELQNLINEAALMAGRRQANSVDKIDFESARDKIIMGSERPITIPEKERRITAVHEAGHAIVAHLIGEDPVHKVSIIPRGRALGVTVQIPQADKYSHSKGKLLSDIAILMAGRAAEEMFIGEVTTGASNDMERATALATNMVAKWGMSEKIGPVVCDMDKNNEQSREVDAEVRNLVEGGIMRARTLLDEHRKSVTAVVDLLLQVETIDGQQIDQIIGDLCQPLTM